MVAVKRSAMGRNHICINIINNAVESIQDKGAITISAGIKNNNCVLSISDTGRGIEEKYINKLFDMNFSTKIMGKGSGLGLYIAKELIERLGMKIKVESQINKGSTFIISI